MSINQKAMESLRFSALFFYSKWYTDDVAPHLTAEQKNSIMHRISQMTLRAPIWLDRETDFTERFPELKPYSHSGKITGLQLCAVMEAILTGLTRPADGQKKLHV